ncbi:MAG: MFS transporter [Sulfolobus sp.]
MYAHWWGRRRLGVIGYGGLVMSLAIMLLGLRVFFSGIIFAGVALVFTAMTLYLLFYHIGVGGVGWVLQGEVIPTEVRGRGAGLLAALDWFGNFPIIFVFPYWKAAYGVFSFFVLELVLSVLALLVVYLFLPETKGVSLEEMTKVFERGLTIQRQYNATSSNIYYTEKRIK